MKTNRLSVIFETRRQREHSLMRANFATSELKRLVREEVASGTPIAKVAKQAGLTRKTVYGWVSND